MDTIGQFLTSVRNAGMARLDKVDIPSSNMRKSIAEILVSEGYLKSFKVARDSKQGVMRVYLSYDEHGQPLISNICRVSKPGKRVYVKSASLKPVRSGYGVSIVSTSKGLMTNKMARQLKVGGEIICQVW